MFAVVGLEKKYIVKLKIQSGESNLSSPSQFVNSQSGAAQPRQMVQSRRNSLTGDQLCKGTPDCKNIPTCQVLGAVLNFTPRHEKRCLIVL